MANPATVTDLENRWRPLTSAQITVAQSLLDDAWALLTTHLSNLDQRLTDAEVSEDAVRAVVCAMVLRVMRNPDGKVSESIDDYTYRRSDAVADGSLYVTADELSLLGGGAVGGAFSITPYAAPAAGEWWW